jgi:small subunit ribosomal protein S9
MIKAKTTPAKVAPAPTKTPKVKVKTPKSTPLAHGVGRRKSSVARVWLRAGKGALVVNGKDFKEYFDTEIARLKASTPFRLIPVDSQFDVEANVQGGGVYSQADAVKLGIARAMLAANENFRPALREHDLLTVDSRVKERKKYGQKAARRKFQFVKR